MAAFNKFQCFVEDVAEQKHKLDADTLKIMLTNTAPVATNTIKGDITEIAAGFGYTAGGQAVTITSSAQSSGTYSLVGNTVTFTASGGTMATWRYAVLYNDTHATDPLIGWWDVGSPVSLADGVSYPIQFTSGYILRLA
jgi:hypothetical protein